MPYWLDWIKRDSKFTLSKEQARMLLSESTVKANLQAGMDPIVLSIMKWERIESVLEELLGQPLPFAYLGDLRRYIGYKTCALCTAFLSLHLTRFGEIKYGSDKCKLCPLANVDQCTKKGSVFDQIEEVMQSPPLDVSKNEETTSLERLKMLVGAMIRNLRSLTTNHDDVQGT